MSNVIDFVKERAIRKSGIKDKAIIEYMVDNQLDPCNPDDVALYVLQTQLIDCFGDVDFDIVSIPLTKVDTTTDYIFCPDFSSFFDDPNK